MKAILKEGKRSRINKKAVPRAKKQKLLLSVATGRNFLWPLLSLCKDENSEIPSRDLLMGNICLGDGGSVFQVAVGPRACIS